MLPVFDHKGGRSHQSVGAELGVMVGGSHCDAFVLHPHAVPSQTGVWSTPAGENLGIIPPVGRFTASPAHKIAPCAACCGHIIALLPAQLLVQS